MTIFFLTPTPRNEVAGVKSTALFIGFNNYLWLFPQEVLVFSLPSEARLRVFEL